MSRLPRNLAKQEQYVEEFPVFRLNDINKNDMMYCKTCKRDYKFEDRFHIKKHLITKTHIDSSNEGLKEKRFLIKTFVSCNITFN